MDEGKRCSIPCGNPGPGYGRERTVLHTLRKPKGGVQTLRICLRYPLLETSGCGYIMAKAEYDRKKGMLVVRQKVTMEKGFPFDGKWDMIEVIQ